MVDRNPSYYLVGTVQLSNDLGFVSAATPSSIANNSSLTVGLASTAFNIEDKESGMIPTWATEIFSDSNIDTALGVPHASPIADGDRLVFGARDNMTVVPFDIYNDRNWPGGGKMVFRHDADSPGQALQVTLTPSGGVILTLEKPDHNKKEQHFNITDRMTGIHI